MAIFYPKLLGEITVDSTNDVLPVTRQTGPNSPKALNATLTQGRYEDVREYAAQLVVALDALDAGDGVAWRISINDTTGIVIIDNDGGDGFDQAAGTPEVDAYDFDIGGGDWAVIGPILGFSGNLAGSNGYTSASKHKYSFYPTRASWWHVFHDAQTEIDDAFTVAHDGTMVADFFYEKVLGTWEYRYLVSEDSDDLRGFWDDIVKQRLSFNIYPDRTVNTVYNKATNTLGRRRWKLHEGVKGFESDFPHRPWTGVRHIRWDLRLDSDDGSFDSIGT